MGAWYLVSTMLQGDDEGSNMSATERTSGAQGAQSVDLQGDLRRGDRVPEMMLERILSTWYVNLDVYALWLEAETQCEGLALEKRGHDKVNTARRVKSPDWQTDLVERFAENLELKNPLLKVRGRDEGHT